MLILRQKTLQSKINAAIAQIPKPEPVKDLTPEILALQSEIETLKAALESHREWLDLRQADFARGVELTLKYERERRLGEMPAPVPATDLTPFQAQMEALARRFESVQLDVAQTDDTIKYLLESPPVIREITSVADPSTSVLAAFQGHWVRPMGQ